MSKRLFFTCSILITLASTLSAQVQIGRGCTTVYYIDKDCDGYGLGKRSNNTYNVGFNGRPVGEYYSLGQPWGGQTGDLADADDNDPTVNTAASWTAKYVAAPGGPAQINAGIVTFLQTVKGFTNTSRVYYVALDGDNATGVVNDPSKPYASAAALISAFRDVQGGVIVFRGGLWTDHGLNGNCCQHIWGSAAKPVYIMAFPGERVETTKRIYNDPNYAPKKEFGYVTYDGFIMRAPAYAQGDAFTLIDTDSVTIRNIEFAGWHQILLNNHNRDSVIEDCVFQDMQFHTVYFGSYGFVNPKNTGDWDFVADEAAYVANYNVGSGQPNHTPGSQYRGIIRNNVMWNTGDSGYEPIHVNTYGRDFLVEGNIVSYSGGSAVGIQTGMYYTTIRNNLFFNNGACAVSFYLSNVNSATIRYNTIENNTVWAGSGEVSIRNKTPMCFVSAYNSIAPGNGVHYIKDITVRNNIAVVDLYDQSSGSPQFDFMTDSYPNTWAIYNNVLWSMATGASVTDKVMVIHDEAYGAGTSIDAGTYNFTEFQAYGGGTSFRNNLYGDPQFVAASKAWVTELGSFNFRLQSTSPAKGFATADAPATDLLGYARVARDAGAYEHGSGGGSSIVMDVIPASLTFGPTTVGASNPTWQTISVSATGGSCTIDAARSVEWLQVSGAGGSTPSALSVQPDLVGVSAGTYTPTISVSCAGATNTPQTVNVSMTLNPAPSISTDLLPNGTPGLAYSESLVATGGTGTLTWSVSAGDLAPCGLTLSSTGVVSGTPVAGTCEFTARAVDTQSVEATKALSVTVDQ